MLRAKPLPGTILPRGALTIAIAAMAIATPALAAELQLISAGAVRGVVGETIEDYSRQSGHKFTFTVGPTGFLRDIIRSGKPADLVITSAPLMAELEQTGKIVPGSRVDIGRVGLGVVVREGAAIPDVSTAEAVKEALTGARAIAFTDPKLGGTSVIHLMKIADSFGIKDAVMQKGVPATGGNDAVAKVAGGQADIAIVLMSEIHAKGAKLVAPLPEPIQLWTVYAAAIPMNSPDPGNARALIATLTAPAMRERWIKAGWQPAQ